MRFENALVALRKGYKVCRKKNLNRLNGIYYKLSDGTISSYTMSGDRQTLFVSFVLQSVLAEDWVLYEGRKNYEGFKHDKN